MELIEICRDTYYFKSAVNIGYVHLKEQEKGMLIDAGLDSQSMKKVIKKLEEKKLPLTHLIITHSHADHYGGAAYLQSTKNIYTIAPQIEEAILRNPILASVAFSHGNYPIEEIRNKFIEGQALEIDEVVDEGKYEVDGFSIELISLPGHSVNQMGILMNDILFAADSYFGIESLDKHKIPYIIDLEQTLSSLDKLSNLKCSGTVPGHGIYEENFQETVHANKKVHQEILSSMRDIIDSYDDNGISHEQIVKQMCDRWDIKLFNMTSFVLYRTAITAYLTKLYKDQQVTLEIIDNTINIKQKKEEKLST
ncbi:glyoxylase-like metal-dependent hydrolase (beta-lactamase superfamily II) [Bacillus mesophilus]|uniref:MBL fold metallo-hydrolase n=1 Tax=Bacillus mesophilus TaxID=1808955 RepID=A0A6M0Q622_9BACI|nr:MBL fold metallo-hydrolase [Bacillus mesophilus]MBM7659702.1 glyoxylase-like metal-dependent hydrolase (beta-lactamase superfamily II) [Bacillus mesophilus]NEY70568.1 MBL fold metallo-hydrolase [Bacillus mesophilus]